MVNKPVPGRPEGKRNVLAEREYERYDEPGSDGRANDEDERPSFPHKPAVCIFKDMLDIESNADRKPI